MRERFINGCALYLGDCLKVLASIEIGPVDAVIVDLPYGTTACAWDSIISLNDMWSVLYGRAERKSLIKSDTPIVVHCSQPFTTVLIASNIKAFRYCWSWVKNLKTGNLNARRQPMGGHEDIAVFYDKPPTYNPQKRQRTNEVKAGNKKNSKTTVYGKQKDDCTDRQSNLINPDTALLNIKCVHNSSGKVHPTQKPVELSEYLIKTYTNRGDLILDFCMGSGTMGVACTSLDRKFVGIERDETYFDIACGRIEKAREQTQ